LKHRSGVGVEKIRLRTPLSDTPGKKEIKRCLYQQIQILIRNFCLRASAVWQIWAESEKLTLKPDPKTKIPKASKFLAFKF